MKKKTNRKKQIKIFLLIILGYDKDFTIESRNEIKNKRDTSRVEKTKIWKNLSFTYYSWLRWKTPQEKHEMKSRVVENIWKNLLFTLHSIIDYAMISSDEHFISLSLMNWWNSKRAKLLCITKIGLVRNYFSILIDWASLTR